MPNDRIAALQKMIERSPDDPRARFGLALELEKLGRWEEAAAQLTRYLELTEDEGNAWGRLGNALRQLGRDDEARAAYTRGIAAAAAHGHPSMAAEFEEILEDW
ncbi:MAG TPA: tetratricopeptide repeat protein [Longimicrobiales bacterium]|nr:tetratricopeptide repeat protein [Longimicrobiales bacterium]